MAIVLYKFDSVEAFPVLGSFSSEHGSIDRRAVGASDDASLMVSLRHDDSGFDTMEAVLALPPRTVAGSIERIELSLVGDRSGCGVALDTEDQTGAVRHLDLGMVGFAGPGSCGYDWPLSEKMQLLQFHRLRIIIGPECASATLILLSLIVRGEVRFLPSGMAQNLPENAQ